MSLDSSCSRAACVRLQLLLVLLYLPLALFEPAIADEGTNKQEWLRIPGEFELQRAIVLSVSDWQPHHSYVLTQIVDKTAKHIEVLILHNDLAQRKRTMEWIKEAMVPSDHVSFCELKLDSIWVRDFAPIISQCQSGTRTLDFYYYGGARPLDEHFPHQWVRRCGGALHELKWTIQGGNFLSNGEYVIVTSTKIYDENRITFQGNFRGGSPIQEGRKILTRDLLKQCNLSTLVILDPLVSEETKHVDMFATFISKTEIVVASVDPRIDPVNAAILDRNARTLAKVKIGDKPLIVHRLPIPPRKGTSWSALTNVIFANDLLLIPKFDSDPENYITNAQRLYGKLRPDLSVQTVDLTSMKQLQGSLHCLSTHIPAFANWPADAISFAEAAKE